MSGSFVNLLHSYIFLKLTTLTLLKDLKLTILFCFIISGIFALVSKVHELDLISLSLKKSFVVFITPISGVTVYLFIGLEPSL